MLPDDFVFQVDVTGRRYHCIRRNDGNFDLRSVNRMNYAPTIHTEKHIKRFIGNGWTIVSVNEDETEIDIENLI